MPSISEIVNQYSLSLKRDAVANAEVFLGREQEKLSLPDSELGNLFLRHFLQEHLRDTSEPVLSSNLYAGGAESASSSISIAVLEVMDVTEIGYSMFSILKAVNTSLKISLCSDAFDSEEGDVESSDSKIPRKILRFVLSDGYTQVLGLEVEHLGPQFSLTMPLGSKVCRSSDRDQKLLTPNLRDPRQKLRSKARDTHASSQVRQLHWRPGSPIQTCQLRAAYQTSLRLLKFVIVCCTPSQFLLTNSPKNPSKKIHSS